MFGLNKITTIKYLKQKKIVNTLKRRLEGNAKIRW